MAEKNEYVLCVPVELTRRFTGLSIDAGKPCLPIKPYLSLASEEVSVIAMMG